MIRRLLPLVLLVVAASGAAAEPQRSRFVDAGSTGRADGGAWGPWVLADVDGDQVDDVVQVGAGSGSTSIRVDLGRLTTPDSGAPRDAERRLAWVAGLVADAQSSPLRAVLSARDVDADHDLDIVLSNRFGDAVGVWLNRGDGTFAPGDPSRIPAAPTTRRTVLGTAPPDGLAVSLGPRPLAETQRSAAGAVRPISADRMTAGPVDTLAGTIETGRDRGPPPFTLL